ncbi:MAG: glycosyltransferase family 39 protein [Bacteroidetes bacterium]|nr:glycosyltransferase family 39 protein [Bacteroidota bacterium]
MKIKFKTSSSLICVYCIAVISAYCYLNIAKWRGNNVIKNDAVSYYAYLPATFIYNDISLNFLGKPTSAGVEMWPEKAPNGKNVIKTSMGVAFFYSPLFFVAHMCAPLFDFESTGYSEIYHLLVGFTSSLYLFLGLLFLRKILLRYYSENTTSFTIVVITLGTNMLYYSTIETLNPHIISFFLINGFLLFIIQWHENQKIKYVITLGLIIGFMTLVRPLNILLILVFLFYNIYDRDSFRNKIVLISRHFFGLVIIPFSTVLIFLPQLIYWKMQTGYYFFNSYIGEQFYFFNPHILEGLFSFRKGWLIYTPVMVLFFVGLFFMNGALKKWRMAIIIFYIVITYILFSWWCWWYGGSFGLRAYIDFYGLFAIPIAALIHQSKSNKKLYCVLLSFCGIFLFLNIAQTYQAKRNIIHYDSMTSQKYRAVFLKFGKETDYSNHLLQRPDYDKAKSGQDEY